MAQIYMSEREAMSKMGFSRSNYRYSTFLMYNSTWGDINESDRSS